MTIPLDYSKDRPKRRFPWGLIIILSLLVITIAISFVVYANWKIKHMFDARERVLLYQTDPQKMLNACTEVWQKRKSYKPWAGVKTDDEFPPPDPTDPAIPAIIRNLNPNFISIDSSSVHIELGGGFFHYGLTACVNGYPGSGTKQLIPGLWYDSENNEIPPP